MTFDELIDNLFWVGENALLNKAQHRDFLVSMLWLCEISYQDLEALKSAWRMKDG